VETVNLQHAAGEYRQMRASRRIALIILAVLLVIFFIVSLGLGRYYVPFGDVCRILLGGGAEDSRAETVVLLVRFPRAVAAALVGAALALSGAAYQGVLRNPLVSPDILGVSSGASVGASIAIIAHLPRIFIQTSALACGGAAVLLTLAISRLFKQTSALTLVLAGIITSALCSSLLSLCQYVADVYEELPNIVFWTLGSLANVQRAEVFSMLPPVLVACGFLLAVRWRINLLSLAEGEAKTLGISVRAMTFLVIACSTVATAAAVCVSGTIGWVGLIVPHLSRLITSNDNTYAMPASALLGAGFLVAVDTIARSITPSEIPLSVITGLIGAPIFIFIIVKRKMALW